MRNMSSREITRDLLGHFLPPRSNDPERTLQTLTKVVLDLMMEIEALRETIASGSTYHDTYRKAGLLTHNNAGPSSGWDKLISHFYPDDESTEEHTCRERLMMQRLGFSSSDIETYKREAEEMELYT